MAPMPTPIRLATALLAVAAVTFAATPVDAAYAFGTTVDKNDADFQPAPSNRLSIGTGATSKVQLPCFLDHDGNGVPDPGETVYLAMMTGVGGACGVVLAKYVRLTAYGGGLAGTEVRVTDADYGKTLTALGTIAVPGHAIRVFKVDPDPTKVKAVDTVYLALKNLPSLRVSVGDIRLTSYGALKAGTYVQAGDVDVNNAVVEMAGGATKSFYSGIPAPQGGFAGHIVYEYGKAHYINTDLDVITNGVEEGDVRLTNTATNYMGDLLAQIGNPGKIVDSIKVTPDVARPGEKVEVVVTLRNISTKIGSALVETRLDGTVVDARGSPTLGLNEVASVMLSLTAPSEAGRHKVQAGDVTFFLDVEGEPVAPGSAATEAPAGSASSVDAAKLAALEAKVAQLEGRLAQAPAASQAGAVPATAPGLVPIVAIAALALTALAMRSRR